MPTPKNNPALAGQAGPDLTFLASYSQQKGGLVPLDNLLSAYAANLRRIERLARHWVELSYHANVLACARTKQERDIAARQVFSAIGDAKDDLPDLRTIGEISAALAARE